MSESRDHRLLVAALVRGMVERGIVIVGVESAGWRRPGLVGRRRPDVIGFYTVGGTVVAGEAKRGPELWDSRQQLQEIAGALPAAGPRGVDALLILGVESGWESEAMALCSTLDADRTTTVVWALPVG